MVRTQETEQMEKNKVVSAMETQELCKNRELRARGCSKCLGTGFITTAWGWGVCVHTRGRRTGPDLAPPTGGRRSLLLSDCEMPVGGNSVSLSISSLSGITAHPAWLSCA